MKSNLNADQIVNNYFGQQNSSHQATGGNQADQIVTNYFSKQSASPNPLDDTAVARAQKDTGDQSYDNYCEMFAEQDVYGRTGLYPTAVSAYANYKQQGVTHDGDISSAPKGALVYFNGNPGNSGEGHVGISDGQGNFVSATSQGVQTYNINQWEQMTNQQPLGWVMPPANPAPNQIQHQSPYQALQQAVPAGFNYFKNPNG